MAPRTYRIDPAEFRYQFFFGKFRPWNHRETLDSHNEPMIILSMEGIGYLGSPKVTVCSSIEHQLQFSHLGFVEALSAFAAMRLKHRRKTKGKTVGRNWIGLWRTGRDRLPSNIFRPTVVSSGSLRLLDNESCMSRDDEYTAPLFLIIVR